MFSLSFGEQTQPYLFPMMAILFLSKPKSHNFKFAIQSRSQMGESHLAIEKTELQKPWNSCHTIIKLITRPQLQNSRISKCTLCQNTVPYIIMQLFYLFILICQHRYKWDEKNTDIYVYKYLDTYLNFCNDWMQCDKLCNKRNTQDAFTINNWKKPEAMMLF